MAGDERLADLEEMTMFNGNTAWCATGPRGALWSIVWYAESGTVAAWPFPCGTTAHRGHAPDLAEARREVSRIATAIAMGARQS